MSPDLVFLHLVLGTLGLMLVVRAAIYVAIAMTTVELARKDWLSVAKAIACLALAAVAFVALNRVGR